MRRLEAAVGVLLAAGLAAAAWGQGAQPAPVSGGAPGIAQPEVAGPELKREPPPLEAEPGTIDLGFMEPGASATGTTKLVNKGSEPLKLMRVSTSCACTVTTDVTGKVLQPGESLELGSTLKGGRFPGPQQKSVQVFVEGYTVPVKIWVVGEVAYGVKSAPNYVDCFQTRVGRVTFESTDGQPFRIISVNNAEPPLADDEPAATEPRNKYTLKYDFQGVEDPKLPRWWVVETDHPRAAVVDLRVINPALIRPQNPKAPWHIMEDRALLGTLRVGESKEFELTMRPVQAPAADAPLPILKSRNDAMKYEALRVEATPDGYHVVHARATALKPLEKGTLLMDEVRMDWLDHEDFYDVFGRIVGERHAARPKND